ncbi:glycosyltransferase family 4 protein [Priestia endophytica]
MKDILIIAHFTQVPGEQGNGRFNYITDMLVSKGYKVEIVTTQFSHRFKKARKVSKEQINKLDYKLTMLRETGYKKNVSLKRFYSHHIFGKSLQKYLGERKKPDLIYCAIPSLDAGYIAAKYAKKNNIKFIIDIQDLWPEAFKLVFNVPFLSNVIFSPMSYLANYIYNVADEVIAVSQTYVDRGVNASKKLQSGTSVFLGTDLGYFDQLAIDSKVEKPNKEVWLAYIGTLGHSYDLISVIDALHKLKLEGIRNIKFIVMGDGPLKQKFMDYAHQKNVYCEFTGRLQYPEMVRKLIKCDFAVNPISKGSAASIINKVGDYAAAGLPVLNTQESKEYRDLLDQYAAGLNCANNDYKNLADAMLKLYNDLDLTREMGNNNRRLAREKFDRKYSYELIVSIIEARL